MKILFSFSIMLISTLGLLHAQVLEETRVMSAGSQPALTIVLPGCDVKFADAEWREFMRPHGKISRVKQAKENVVSDIQLLDIGGVNRLNVYSLAEQGSDGAKMTVWFDMGPGFISSEAYPTEYVAAVKFLKEYAHKVKVDLITEELASQEKVLSKAESSLTTLQRQNDNYHKAIEDAKKKIEQAEKDIEKNFKDQKDAQKEIDAHKDALKAIQKKLDDAKSL